MKVAKQETVGSGNPGRRVELQVLVQMLIQLVTCVLIVSCLKEQCGSDGQPAESWGQQSVCNKVGHSKEGALLEI